MSRSEWWTVVLLLFCILMVLIIITVYCRFIWDQLCKNWSLYWEDKFYYEQKIAAEAGLHLGDEARSEPRSGSGRVLGERRTDLPEDFRDAPERSPFIR